ncbi:hypothetical protein G7Z17_g3777 [Cylindrodendrum hubeiense]|uniref:Uncharacterized protein n=1 Tax=Cylindrodendrum hubeiense TaxID=595255 RepID=A0A9P5HI52_9HYPO|nr:hypothetical protein G7Z17_g3777 [Cylindrodendrum hubeiense]
MKFSTALVFLATAFSSVLAAPAVSNAHIARSDANLPQQRDLDDLKKRSPLIELNGGDVATLATRSDDASRVQNEARGLESRDIGNVIARLQILITTIRGSVGLTLATLVPQLIGIVLSVLGALFELPAVLSAVLAGLTAAIGALLAGNATGAIAAIQSIIDALQAAL